MDLKEPTTQTPNPEALTQVRFDRQVWALVRMRATQLQITANEFVNQAVIRHLQATESVAEGKFDGAA